MRDKQLVGYLLHNRTFVTTILTSQEESDVTTKALAEILQSNVASKYYLSATACAGILRRAKERGKTLPEALHRALEDRAAQTKPVVDC